MLMRPPALGPSERASSVSMVPRCSIIPVNILQVSFDREVRAELLDADIFQRRMREFWSNGKRHAIVPGDFRGVEQNQFVDHAGAERLTVQRWPAFEEHAEN